MLYGYMTQVEMEDLKMGSNVLNVKENVDALEILNHICMLCA